jgi:general secretion pathway protein F
MRYEVRAIKQPQGVTVLALDAADEAQARLQAVAQGYAVLAVKTKAAWLFNRERFPLLLFSQQLVALLDAGLGLIEALQGLSQKLQDGEAQTVLLEVLEHLYQGHTLSAALERCPAAFPLLYVATVRASEKTGNLGPALSRYITYQVQVEVLRSKLVTASIYPALLMLVGGTVTLFLLGYVVPKFTAIYADLGREQPVTSRMLMHLGGFLNQNGGTLAILAVATIAAAAYVLANTPLREALFARLPKIPALSERLRVVQLARFYRTAGMLLRGGIPAVSALEMLRSILHAGLRPNLDAAVRDVREGKPLSAVMETHGLTTPIALRMLRVGERTGDIGGMMERIASFHDDEIAQWMDRVTRLFEPLLMVFIGLVIGIIVLSLYMPIFELAGTLQ